MMNPNWLVVSYFTENPPYPECANRLISSLQALSLPYDVVSVKDLGDWYKNTQFKPVFLQRMFTKYSPKSLVCVDADAVFLRYPEYFDYLDNWNGGPDIALYVLDHSKFGRRGRTPELLSGTIFLRNTPTTSIILERWVAECRKNPVLWDQRALVNVLKDFAFHLLPEEYCTIFDYMASVKDPVIKHFQASRAVRKARRIPKTNQVYVVKRK